MPTGARVTDADRHILRAIAELTEANGGRPPTLEEVTVAIGFQSAARGNVYRQLKRLSPEYVTWAPGSSRSLRVTSAGHALLDTNIPQHLQDLPLPDTILPLLASGLTKLVAEREEGRIVQAPYPIAWRRALAMLSAECFQRGIFDAPATTVEGLAWCRIPVSDWKVTFSSQFRTLDMPLLDEADEPTALCHEYAHVGPGDAELELSERIMLSVRATARAFRLPEAYVTFREFVITHPIVEQEELMRVSFDSQFDRLGSELNALYEPVPTTLAEDGAIRTCGFCGWTLERRNGRLRCGDDRCRLLTDDFREGTGRLSVPPERLLRVRRAIRRYVVAPGKYEVNAAADLRRLGVTVDLWPQYDLYDLRIHVDEDEAWAVDIKDWRYPHLLARRLADIPNAPEAAWARAFYAIPDVRVTQNPSYLTYLKAATTRPSGLPNFSIVTIKQLIAQVRARIAHAHDDAPME